jgi:hypothetical protein
MISSTDVEYLGFETNFTLQKSLGKIFHVLPHVIAWQPTPGLDEVIRRAHRLGGESELPMHAGRFLHWTAGGMGRGEVDGPIYAESWIYALFRPNTTHGAVAGEYLDALEAVLK